MALLDYIPTDSPLHAVDPRARLLVCLLLAGVLAVCQHLPVLTAALLAAAALALAARLPPRALARRLLGLNLFLALLWLALPLGLAWGGRGAEAARLALTATLKANAILLLLTTLVSTIEVVTLGHALAHLRLPRKLVHLFLFTVRYTEVLHREFVRLNQAMKVRAFQPRCDGHTYRSLSALAGWVLVRSLDRADRVLAAMKCRGYHGEFHLLHHFHYHRADRWFLLGGSLAALALAFWEFR